MKTDHASGNSSNGSSSVSSLTNGSNLSNSSVESLLLSSNPHDKRVILGQMCGVVSEHTGKSSSMRLMSFVALLAAIMFGLLTVLHAGDHGVSSDNTDGIYITFGFLIAAFAPKAVQKFAEIKLE